MTLPVLPPLTPDEIVIDLAVHVAALNEKRRDAAMDLGIAVGDGYRDTTVANLTAVYVQAKADYLAALHKLAAARAALPA